MQDLIARLEKATGPDGNLDIDIYKLVDANAPATSIMEYKLDHDGLGMWRCKHQGQDFGSWWHLPEYTASIDAALTLVPAGWSWEVRQSGFDGTPSQACLWNPKRAPRMGTDIRVTLERRAAAVALCIAALKARAP